MKNRITRITIFLSVLFCMTLITGCASIKEKDKETISMMEKEESKAVSMDFIGGKDVMPITGFYGPTANTNYQDGYGWPDTITDDYFKLISDAGINMIVYQTVYYEHTPEYVMKSLELGEKYNVGIWVQDTEINGLAGKGVPSATQLTDKMSEYLSHPAFCGYHLVDEPDAPYYTKADGSRLISHYGDLTKVLQEDLDLFVFANMLPIDNFPLEKENYERYVNEFCETFKPKILMWDYYIYDTYGKPQAYFWNMDLMRQKSEEYNIPFWAFIQAGGRWRTDDPYLDSETYHPNEAEFNWNVNTCLAFGAQGIQYFPLLQPSEFVYRNSQEGDFECNGLIGAKGNINQWYYYAQNINKHIVEIDEVLMNSVNKGIIVSGEQAKEDVQQTTCILESGKFQELISVSGDAMVGCFNYNGKTALYVVNYSTEFAQNITLDFNATCNIEVIQNAMKSYVKSESLTLDMAAGEGVLLVLE